MKLLQPLFELFIDTINRFTHKGKPNYLTFHIRWFNEETWVTRIQGNGQFDLYAYRPYTIF
jgi:hypothetical protein